MKRWTLILVLLLAVCAMLVGCKAEEVDTYTVVFDYGYEYKMDTALVKAGETVAPPDAVERDGYRFAGWMCNGKKFNFNTPVNADMEMHAIWAEMPGYLPVGHHFTGYYVIDTDGVLPVNVETDDLKGKHLYADYASNDMKFEDVEGGKKLVDINKTLEGIIIPATFEGKEVISIKSNMLRDSKVLKKVALPESLSTIEYRVFAEVHLDEVIVSSSVRNIEQMAFTNSTIGKITFKDNPRLNLESGAIANIGGLKEIRFPRGVTKLESKTFWGCYDLEKAYIPNSVESLSDSYIFMGCTSLRTIYLEKKADGSDYDYGMGTWNHTDDKRPSAVAVVKVDDLDKI